MHTVFDLVQPTKVQPLATSSNFKVGQAIARAEGVVIEEFSPEKVTASVCVPGMTAICHTQLTVDFNGLNWRCSCTGDSELFCRHLVATALVVWNKASKHMS